MGAQCSADVATAGDAPKPLVSRKRRTWSPFKRSAGQEPNTIKRDATGIPSLCLYDERFNPAAAYFQLRHSAAPESSFTDAARANMLREYDLVKCGGIAGTTEGVLEHYGTKAVTISRIRKALAESGSTAARRSGKCPRRASGSRAI